VISDIVLLEIDSSTGSLKWNTSFNCINPYPTTLLANTVVETNGIYVVTGSYSAGSMFVVWGVKTDGSIAWTRYIPNNNYPNYLDKPIGAIVTSDNGIEILSWGSYGGCIFGI
jgi:hypothetical protein